MEVAMRTLVALTVLAGAAAWSQERPGLKARELFYAPPPDTTAPATKPADQPAPKPAPVAKAPVRKAAAKRPAQIVNVVEKTPAPAVPLGLRYSVLKRSLSGRFEEVDADATFRSGDRIRLQVDANTTGYLYVVMLGSSGNWRLLFPSSEVAGGSNRIEKGESRQIPPGDRGQFVFDEQSGVEKLFLVLSRQPEADLDKLIYSIGGPQGDSTQGRTLLARASVGDDVVMRLRQQMASRDLVFEKVDAASDVKGENATYVVNPSSAADARLVVDLALKHK
jgi:hypothetical protein